MITGKELSFGGLSHFRKEVAPMINYVTYENMFAFALVIIGVLALLQNKRK
jgi:hypothetical protein